MPRPIKCRKISHVPKNTKFSPEKDENIEVEELKYEEIEAMRLKDIEDLSQEEAAVKMQVSRQTFQNIIDSARKKVAIALCEGKSIHIKGGYYKIRDCKLKCQHCGTLYPLEHMQDRIKCPVCKSEDVICSTKGKRCERECLSE